MQELRERLQLAYESAVVMAARDLGGKPRHFGEAVDILPAEVFDRMRDAYRKQVEAL